MNTAAIGAALLGGAALGGLVVRPLVIAYARPKDEPAAVTCQGCGGVVLAPGVRSVARLATARCAACSTRIGPRPGVAEAVTGAAVGAVVAAGSGGWLLAAQLWVTVLGAALALIDLTVRRLPDHLTAAAAAGVALLLAGATLTGQPVSTAVRAVLAAAVLAVVFFPVLLFGGIAWGDYKVLPALGALLGWGSWFAVATGLLAGFCLGALQGVAMLAAGRASWGSHTRLALGPALIVGAVAASVALSY